MRHTRHLLETVAIAAAVMGCIGLSMPASAEDARPSAGGSAILPAPEPQFGGVIGRTAKESTPDFPQAVTAPKGAPNVLLIMTDDTGFGAASTFGGPIPTPALDRVAQRGLRYNQFHTTALCSPTRAALLSGRNHHVCNMGSITETATAFPGQTGQRPNSVAPLAEMLRLNGYSTAPSANRTRPPPGK